MIALLLMRVLTKQTLQFVLFGERVEAQEGIYGTLHKNHKIKKSKITHKMFIKLITTSRKNWILLLKINCYYI